MHVDGTMSRGQGGAPRWIGHIFRRVCKQNGIEHRLTKPYHPRIIGREGRMVRSINAGSWSTR